MKITVVNKRKKTKQRKQRQKKDVHVSPKSASEIISLCPPRILFLSCFSFCPSSLLPSSRRGGGSGGGRQGASRSAKNCIDTRGGRPEWGTEGRVEGGGKGGLSCGSGSAVSVSETGPSRNQPVSVSERAAGEWRRLRSRVYHTASVCVRVSVFLVFVRLRASVRASVLVISSCQKPGRDLATPS